jgi:hypothetical protein
MAVKWVRGLLVQTVNYVIFTVYSLTQGDELLGRA